MLNANLQQSPYIQLRINTSKLKQENRASKIDLYLIKSKDVTGITNNIHLILKNLYTV